MNNPAIVFNCSYNGLSILQELGSHGIDCTAMDCTRGIGTFTKYARYIKCPNPIFDEQGFIDQLYKLCSKNNDKAVLIPTNDEWAYAISKHKKYLQEVAYPCVADFNVIKKIINKDQFYRIGQNNNYLTPKLFNIDNEDVVFPIVAKPIYKAISANKDNNYLHKIFRKRRFTVINNKNELYNFLKDVGKHKNHFLFQEYVRGLSDSMYTVGIYADQRANIKAIFSGRKVRGYPADMGDSIVGMSLSVPEILIDNTRKIVTEMKYNGIAEFEYKKDILTGEYRLIEINPRAWSWIGITPYCGINLPLIAYKDMCGIENNSELKQSEEEIRYVKVYQDMLNCLLRYRFSHPAWAMSFKKWLSEMRSHKNVYAEIQKGDYRIAVMSILYVLAKLVTR